MREACFDLIGNEGCEAKVIEEVFTRFEGVELVLGDDEEER
jgi:hypothetical protein